MGAYHLSSAFAHLANPRQWSRAPTCNLKGSGAESGSCAYCGLKPSRGLIRVICGLFPPWINDQYGAAREMYVIRSARDERSSPCVFRSVFKLFTRTCYQNKLAGCQPNRDSWCQTNWLIWRDGDDLNMQNKTKFCMCMHTQKDVAESSQNAFRLILQL